MARCQPCICQWCNSQYFLLQVFWVILLFCQIVLLFDINVLMLPWWPDVTIVQSDATIVVLWQLSTGSIHDYVFCYCLLVGIIFEVLSITKYWYIESQYHQYQYILFFVLLFRSGKIPGHGIMWIWRTAHPHHCHHQMSKRTALQCCHLKEQLALWIISHQ